MVLLPGEKEWSGLTKVRVWLDWGGFGLWIVGRVALLWHDVLGTRIDRIYWLVGCVFIRLGWFAWACVAREMRGDEG